jgi:site-specific recombinase XerD
MAIVMTTSVSFVDSQPEAGATVLATTEMRGRPSMLNIPKVQLSTAWQDAWLGFELHQLALERSPKTIANRRSAVELPGRWCMAKGIEDPAHVTKNILQEYLIKSYAERHDSGPVVVYQDLQVFWKFWSEDADKPDPSAGLPRPNGKAKTVAVLKPGQIEAVLAGCKGRSKKDTVRNEAIVWRLLESGVRRAELTPCTGRTPPSGCCGG